MKKYYLAAILWNILWSLSYVFQKTATQYLPVSSILFWRFLIGALSTLPLLLIFKIPIKIPGKFITRILTLGLVSYCTAPMLQIYGIKFTRAVNAGILVSTEPVFNIIVAVLFLKERLKAKDKLGFLIIFSGVVILSGVGFSMEAVPAELWFNLLILGGVFLESLSTPIGKTAKNVIHPFALAFFAYLTASLGSLSISLFQGDILIPDPVPSELFESLLYLGIICTTIAYTGWYWTVQYLDVSRICLFIYIQPISASIFAWIKLGEQLSYKDTVAMLLIFTGIGICILDDLLKKTTKPPQENHSSEFSS